MSGRDAWAYAYEWVGPLAVRIDALEGILASMSSRWCETDAGVRVGLHDVWSASGRLQCTNRGDAGLQCRPRLPDQSAWAPAARLLAKRVQLRQPDT